AIAPTATQRVTLGGNLPAGAPVNADGSVPGSQVVTSITVYDKQGAPHDVTFTFTHTQDDPNQIWEVEATMADVTTDDPLDTLPVGSGTFTWDPQTGAWDPALELDLTDPLPNTVGDFDDTIEVRFGAATDPDALTGFAGSNTVAALSQDGAA